MNPKLTNTLPGELSIPPDLIKQIATLTIRRDILSTEFQCNLKQIEWLNKMTKTLSANDPERIVIKTRRETIVNRQMEITTELTPIKVELKRLHTLDNEAKRVEAAQKKEENRRREYNRQFTARMHRIWESKGKREALKRIERENKELLGEGENENHE